MRKSAQKPLTFTWSPGQFRWFLQLHAWRLPRFDFTLNKEFCVNTFFKYIHFFPTQVEAQSPHGICFVANSNVVRSGFVLAPVLIMILIGHVFLYRGLLILIRLKLGSAASISASANSKLRNTIVRLISFSASVIGAVVLTLFCHVYEFERRSQWKTSFRSYMV